MTKGRILQYTTKQDKKEFRGETVIPTGTRIYLIEYSKGKYFYCGYTSKVSAAKVKDRLTGDEKEVNANQITNPDHCVISLIEHSQVN